MDLSIIIVSWNTRELTLRCLKSIFQSLKGIEWEVFLVDNNSSDGTVESARQAFSSERMRIIENISNVGFAKANNMAVKQAKGEYVLLLNSDTELLGDSITKMINFAGGDNKIGIMGNRLLNSDGTVQHSCRRFPTLLDQLFIQLKFYNFFPEKIKAIREYFMLDFEYNEIREVDQVMGAAMLIKSEVFEKVGLFDEFFWAVFEEVDFCQRTKKAGYKIYFYPYFEIIHHKEQSFKQWPVLKKQINFNRSLYHYFRKHKPWWQFFILWLVQPANLLLTGLDEVVGIRKVFGKNKDL